MKLKDIKDLVEFLESRGCTERQVCEAVYAAMKEPAGKSMIGYKSKSMSINDMVELANGT